jgi:hypothetical protein
MAKSRDLTLLDVIQAVSEEAANDQETVATVAHLITSGQVRLGDEAVRAMLNLLATMDPAAWGLEGRSTMQQANAAITWSEGVTALVTLGIISFLLLV